MKEKIKPSNIKNIIILSKIISNYEKRSKSRALRRSFCRSALEFRAFFSYVYRYPNFSAIRTLNDEVQISSRRRDITELLTSAMLTRRRDLVTSRRHHVATWQTLLALLCLAPQKLLLITALFTPLYLQPHQTQNQGSRHKNYEIPIKQT